MLRFLMVYQYQTWYISVSVGYLKPSPAILNSIIQNCYKQSHPDMSRVLADSFYVDDFVGGAVFLQQGEEFFLQISANNESR